VDRLYARCCLLLLFSLLASSLAALDRLHLGRRLLLFEHFRARSSAALQRLRV
jgi:hypothetical protein